MFQGTNHPSDIDMFYYGKNGIVIFREIKNESYDEKNWEHQKKLFQKVVDGFEKEAMWLFIIHDKYWQKGDTKVDVPECIVKEYCYKKPNYKSKWITPRKETKVKEVLKYYGLTN